MSAPLVVNTTDGTSWTRRAVTRKGDALYALAAVEHCPETVMATLAELAEHGIAGTADALPVPVGPQREDALVDDDRAKAPWGRGEDGRPLLPMGAHWTDVPELLDRNIAGIRSRLDQAHSGNWHLALASEGRPPGTVRTNVNGYPRTVGQFTNVWPADLDLVLHAHADLSWCLEMIAKFRARVAELEAERHSTNEALDDAVQTLRADRDGTAGLEAAQAPGETYPPALPWAALMDHEDLTDFLDELAASAITHASSEVALAEIEATCGRWRLIAEAQHAHNTAPGQLDEWCTGCNADHDPAECGYRPATGGAR